MASCTAWREKSDQGKDIGMVCNATKADGSQGEMAELVASPVAGAKRSPGGQKLPAVRPAIRPAIRPDIRPAIRTAIRPAFVCRLHQPSTGLLLSELSTSPVVMSPLEFMQRLAAAT